MGSMKKAQMPVELGPHLPRLRRLAPQQVEEQEDGDQGRGGDGQKRGQRAVQLADFDGGRRTSDELRLAAVTGRVRTSR
jgi:hypothetical protein